MTDLYDSIGVGPGFDEAEGSYLPGLHNGPADAYRHMLGAAELTRRYGETAARAMLEANEVKGDVIDRQSAGEREMDSHNNDIGIAIGQDARTFDEIRERARAKIDAGVREQGSGANDTPKWPPSSEWKNTPDNPNWPPDWSRAEPATGYEYGGEEHRYRPHGSDAPPGRHRRRDRPARPPGGDVERGGRPRRPPRRRPARRRQPARRGTPRPGARLVPARLRRRPGATRRHRTADRSPSGPPDPEGRPGPGARPRPRRRRGPRRRPPAVVAGTLARRRPARRAVGLGPARAV